MLKDLVTVTCLMDLEYMILQAESIQKYLEPCTHWIIVNELVNDDLIIWKNALQKYYTKHELKLIKQSDLFDNQLDENGMCILGGGTYTQQVCKLEIAKLIKNDYLILDSKNFFVKETSISEWDSVMGCNYYINNTDYDWQETIKIYCEKLDINVPNIVMAPQTPYKIKITENLLNTVYKDFIKVDKSSSEFILYYLTNIKEFTDVPLEPIKFFIYFYHFFDDLKYNLSDTLQELDSNLNFKVSGFHRKFINRCDPNHISTINKWLRQKKFQFQFKVK